MERQRTCEHAVISDTAHAGISVRSCAHCPDLQFSDQRGTVNATVALGRLFGDFDLIGGLDAVGAPGREVLMYRAADRLTAAALRIITPHRWFRANENLWICHDSDHLLFSHNSPTVSHLVGA